MIVRIAIAVVIAISGASVTMKHDAHSHSEVISGSGVGRFPKTESTE